MTWDAEEFGETWAEVYDDAFAHLDADGGDAATFLASRRLGARGRLLELGVGTGRVAIPLARAGFDVIGLDASPRMLTRLSQKVDELLEDGTGTVTGVLGDMTAPPVEGPFDVILIAFNTFYALSSQDAQIACVAACADLLGPFGELVIEANVPEPWRFTGQASARDAREDQVALEMASHDPVTQTVRSARVLVSDTVGVRTLPLKMRYAWPSEVDLMARLAGLQRLDRFAGWMREEFDADAARHVSIYVHTEETP